MSFELSLISHRLEIPNFEAIFVDWSYRLGLVAVADGALLRQLEHNTFKSIDIPNSECFIVSNRDQRIPISGKLNQSNYVKMGLNPFWLSSCFSIYYYEIVSAPKCYFLAVYWERTGHGCELDFVLFRKKTDFVHRGSVKHAGDHLRFVHNCLLEVSSSEGTLVKDRIRQIGLRNHHIIKIQVRKDVTDFIKKGYGIGTGLRDRLKLFCTVNYL